MQRKLVKQGAATLMISLPSKWIQKNALDKGDEISLYEENENLIISKSGKKEEIQKATLDVSDLHPLINRALIALYIKGMDEIEVVFSNKNEIKDFSKKILPELLGFEIIKQTSSSIVLRDITGCEKQEVDSLIKRIILILDSIAEEIINGVENKQALNSAIEADISVNRLTNFCLRILNKKDYIISSKKPQIYGLLNLLEEIGDNYKKIAQFIDKNPKLINKKHLLCLQESRELLKYYNELIFNFNREKVVECSRKYKKLKEELNTKSVIDIYIYELLMSIIRINNYLLVYSLGKE